MRIVLLLAAVAAFPGRAWAGADSPVTFARDVAPILYKHCAECHRPTMFAPMSLMTYEDARPSARSTKPKVAARQMPPWGAHPAFGTFTSDPRLTQQAFDTVVASAGTGTP